MKTSHIIFIFLVSIIVAIYSIFHIKENNWFKGLIPSAIEIKNTVYIKDVGFFREGCGVAIFSLKDTTLSRIRALGVSALADAHKARSHGNDHYFTFGEWKSTPYKITGDGLTLEDRWLNGMGCGKINHQLYKSIQEALDTSGSYYAKTPEAGLIIIPSLGIIVLSFEG